jgi:flavorubredoxin
MSIELYNKDEHKCFKFHDFTGGEEEQSNQFLIIHKGRGLLIDPGGYKLYSPLIYEVASYLPLQSIDYIFLSHQDPDVGAGLNGWLHATDAMIMISSLWKNFIPNFCSKELVNDRLITIPDRGKKLMLSDTELLIIPAHFLHSPGNFQVYDNCSKILFSGDLGASLNVTEENIDTQAKFAEHIKFMEFFHRRYITTGLACSRWADMIRSLEIEMIIPQHGSRITGRDLVKSFIDWVGSMKCGLDIMEDIYKLPL